MSYQKNDGLIFVSQLDLQRLFRRIFMRAQVKLEYSKGFNPHPKMTYSPPVSMFISSACEYADFETSGDEDAADLKIRLSAVLPDGICINSVEKLDEGALPLPELLKWAEYEYKASAGADVTAEDIESEYEKCSLVHEKTNKKNKIVRRDLKEHTKNLQAEVKDGIIEIRACHSMENNSMVNPRAFISLFFKNSQLLKDSSVISVRKTRAGSDI